MTVTNPQSIRVGDNAIGYDRRGVLGAPTVVLLTGWCQDHRLFDPLLPHLTDEFDVIRIDWRGHGADRRPIADFGPAEQTADTLAVLDALEVDRFLPLSTSHGGWADIEIAERAGLERVPATIVIDWIMTAAGPEFLAGLDGSQDPQGWRAAQQGLFDVWIGDSDHPVVRNHLDAEMAAFDYDMWALSCRVIKEAYLRWGSPLERMRALPAHPTIRHLFSQPTDPAYAAAQADFAEQNPWFSYRNLGGPTHFPTLDSPAAVAKEIAAVLAEAR